MNFFITIVYVCNILFFNQYLLFTEVSEYNKKEITQIEMILDINKTTSIYVNTEIHNYNDYEIGVVFNFKF